MAAAAIVTEGGDGPAKPRKTAGSGRLRLERDPSGGRPQTQQIIDYNCVLARIRGIYWKLKVLPAIIRAGDSDMPKDVQPEFIESTAGEVAAELVRRGIRADQRVTVTIEPAEPDDWISKARAYAHPKVMAEGWNDADIDRIIKEERRAVQPQNG
jgi:hypothetical protein